MRPVLLRPALMLLLGVPGCGRSSARTLPAKSPADSTFILVTRGIVGGIIQPPVRFQMVVVPSGTEHTVAVRIPSRAGAPDTFRMGHISEEEMRAFVQNLDSAGLWSLPVESPEESQDIYRLDRSLVVVHRARTWGNSAPGGCVQGRSGVWPSEGEAVRFRTCLRAATHLAYSASTPADRTTYLSMLDRFSGGSPDSDASDDPGRLLRWSAAHHSDRPRPTRDEGSGSSW